MAFHISRVALDKWSTREQLCLASAVSSCSSGDQNWMSVSRALKSICGSNRPVDWFSQKSCAVQYGHMVENIETQKIKKRPSEDSSLGTSCSGVAPSGVSTGTGETSTDSILRRLTEERIKELKAEIQIEQEEYAKAFVDLNNIQNGQLDEIQIAEMWKEIEKEQEMQRIEEMKMENQLREHEQRKQEMHRNWRSAPTVSVSGGSGIAASTVNFSQRQDDKQSVELNLEEIIGSNTTSTGIQQQATSPLLSSLLKSPTPGGSNTSIGTPAHASAPTITNLLTGGTLNPNQPALTLKSTVAPNEAVQLLTRPISGPPIETFSTASTTSQSLLSPSQSAPTLSMLLEKNKSTNATGNTSNSAPFSEGTLEVKADSLISDSNNEVVPMDIEEDVACAISSNDLIDPNDSDADANEEQQLLEVFKNIGNIDELGDIDVSAVIDEEVDFLKSVGDDNADVEDDMDFDAKMAAAVGMNNDLEQLSKNEFSEIDDLEVSKQTNKDHQAVDAKIETISSDDSNDNIPLATLGSNSSHEFKDNFNKSQEKVSDTNNQEKNEMIRTDAFSPRNVLTHLKSAEDNEEEDTNIVSRMVNEGLEEHASLPKSPESVNSDVIIIPTDEESNGSKLHMEKLDESKGKQDLTNEMKLTSKLTSKLDESKDEMEFSSLPCDTIESSCSTSPTKEIKDYETVMQAPPPTTISLADTDEDSSTTDISVSTKKDEKYPALSKLNNQSKRDHKTENKFEEDTSNVINQTPVKLPAVRKLRDRDRSESPLTAIDDDTTASEHSVTQRSRRRYSSTPIMDSIPNSPASSDREDRDVKVSKKSLMSIYYVLMNSKNASSFQRVYSEHALKLKQICNRYVDIHLIKKNIENHVIRNIHELQRDILLMCQNAIMTFETNSSNYKIAYDFMLDCQNIKDFLSNGCIKEMKPDKETKDIRTSASSYSSSPLSSSVKVRGSARKSQRIS